MIQMLFNKGKVLKTMNTKEPVEIKTNIYFYIYYNNDLFTFCLFEEFKMFLCSFNNTSDNIHYSQVYLHTRVS